MLYVDMLLFETLSTNGSIAVRPGICAQVHREPTELEGELPDILYSEAALINTNQLCAA
jgi:hypothetical protein